MRRIQWSRLSAEQRRSALARPAVSADVTRESVTALIDTVRTDGDDALVRLTERFDGVRLSELGVSEDEFASSIARVEPQQRRALEHAWRNLATFHAPQRPVDYEQDTEPGIRCRRVVRPIARVGLYVPGGSAPLASTALMLGVPSQVAGCPARVLCTPPRRDGTIDPHVLYAASLVGIEPASIFKVGGAQAIAAMAYGTRSVPKVDKIFGPGNGWVTTAKQIVSEDPSGAAIDMPAGPSEVMVVADSSARPEFVAADLLSQAEHDSASHVLLVATDTGLADDVLRELEHQLEALPRRDIARASIRRGLIIEATAVDEIVDIVEAYAPEHLILQLEGARHLVDRISTAGSVFVGPWSPESAGDYATGTNHVLPTYGAARVLSGLGVEAFTRTMMVQELTSEGLERIGPTLETLAELEGLAAHRNAVAIRRGALAGPQSTGSIFDSAIASLARPAVRSLVAYASARSEVAAAPVLLDANENAFAPAGSLNRYPAPQPRELVELLAGLYQAPSDNLIVGRGSDEIIDWLIRTFCDADRDAVMTCPPTYTIYRTLAALQGASVTEVPLVAHEGFAVDAASILARWTVRHKLLFLCSPNNPTGTTVPSGVVRRLCDDLAGRGLVVVDQAYAEFAPGNGLCTRRRPTNLVVLRTLSKAFGLAGARCGAAIAAPDVISLLQKVRAPYPLAAPAVDAVFSALTTAGIARARASIRDLVELRKTLASAIGELPIVERVFPSEANFLLVRVRDVRAVMSRCREAGVIIRDRSHELGLERCVRITIGTPAENALLVASLREVAA